MSIATEIQTLTENTAELSTCRGDIRTALEGKGVSASDHDFSDFASDIDAIPSGGGLPSGTNIGDILVWNGTSWVAQQPSRLPAGYQEVEYIESTGTQYIDTGIKPSTQIKTVSRSALTDLTAFSLEGINSTSGLWTWGSTSRLEYFESRVGNNASTSWRASSVPVDMQIHTFEIASGSQKIDGTEYATDVVTSTNPYPVMLFARVTDNGYVNEFARCRAYDFKAYSGSQIIMHLIPCYEIDTGEIGMFDVTNFKFYTNAGTGTFIKGPDV